ncbi:MAG: hypothetical protein GF329_06110 [Candidatus Lokiarchaeota archaeon]|nr:hypothetical protein [Candidatus Lokiarchaeota archaeon]
MLIDMHLHTKPRSPCSNMTPEDAVREAIDIGLDSIVITEHNLCWKKDELDDLRQKFDEIIIFNAIEVTAIEGDILIYNFYTEDKIDDLPKAQELRDRIGEDKSKFMAVAHPFREFLVVGIGSLGIDMDELLSRPIFGIVDGVETRNGQVSKKANRLANTVCKKKGLHPVGGSDAHELAQIGACVTEFKSNDIKNQVDLVKELYKGNYEVKYFRK